MIITFSMYLFIYLPIGVIALHQFMTTMSPFPRQPRVKADVEGGHTYHDSSSDMAF